MTTILRYTEQAPALKADLESIERQLREALVDEEKAAPFYKKLRGNLFSAGIINPLSNESSILRDIIRDEERHKKDLGQIEKAIKEYRRMHPRIPGLIR